MSAGNSNIHATLNVVIVIRTAIITVAGRNCLVSLLKYDVVLIRILLPLCLQLLLMRKNGVEEGEKHVSQVPTHCS